MTDLKPVAQEVKLEASFLNLIFVFPAYHYIVQCQKCCPFGVVYIRLLSLQMVMLQHLLRSPWLPHSS